MSFKIQIIRQISYLMVALFLCASFYASPASASEADALEAKFKSQCQNSLGSCTDYYALARQNSRGEEARSTLSGICSSASADSLAFDACLVLAKRDAKKKRARVTFQKGCDSTLKDISIPSCRALAQIEYYTMGDKAKGIALMDKLCKESNYKPYCDKAADWRSGS